MSTTFRIFFTGLFLLGCLTFVRANITPETRDSLLNQANFFYQYDQHQRATQIYEEVLQTGYFYEQMLYRLGSMAEQAEDYPRAIFYLRKIQWEFGGQNVESKVLQLVRKMTRERISVGNRWTDSQLAARHYENYLVWGMVLATIILILMMALARAQLGRALGIALTTAIIMCTTLLLVNYYQTPDKAIMVSETRFYDFPGYGSLNRSLPIFPGAMVDVLEKQDIWCKVSMGKFTGWVPTFSLREV